MKPSGRTSPDFYALASPSLLGRRPSLDTHIISTPPCRRCKLTRRMSSIMTTSSSPLVTAICCEGGNMRSAEPEQQSGCEVAGQLPVTVTVQYNGVRQQIWTSKNAQSDAFTDIICVWSQHACMTLTSGVLAAHMWPCLSQPVGLSSAPLSSSRDTACTPEATAQ